MAIYLPKERSSSSDNSRPNPDWRSDLTEPPFVKANPAGKCFNPDRFETKKSIRLRKRPKCLSIPASLSSDSRKTTKYSLLAAHVPFRDEYSDLWMRLFCETSSESIHRPASFRRSTSSSWNDDGNGEHLQRDPVAF
eukprot:TRINITY_DN22451_c0_g1_i1.p1 TRINITY_DN22451_c0_g1~~TRINITY_DN22451_c0_g1_i1.p1  ORF type:complete len:137 (+),score=3.30 TRINITY_DN22451_c0_g1_i1:401-811(+)